jgi:hypothetical protein
MVTLPRHRFRPIRSRHRIRRRGNRRRNPRPRIPRRMVSVPGGEAGSEGAVRGWVAARLVEGALAGAARLAAAALSVAVVVATRLAVVVPLAGAVAVVE